MKHTYVLCMLLVAASMPACFWSNTPSGGGSTNDPAQKKEDQPVADTAKKVFVTRALFTGKLGGLAGADAKCATAAAAAGLPGTFLAYLSTDTVAAATRVTGAGPWSNAKGKLIFDGGASRWAGFPKAGLEIDETGGQVYGYEDGGSGTYWTGSDAQGVSGPDHCKAWTEEQNSYGVVGTKSTTGAAWVNSGRIDCSRKQSLICFQND